ncbi:hypothetical protein [Methylobacterium gregans]|uniref:Uncharacterized protein n=1 Tax=Methylobacterium gregans TaxID=374424 RepID=A0AA37MAU1_9HYPH|nr:hypothetical protein [Methylobacterium gregans]MDQ0521999.1 hypothetical protein [Methylobacterium gregans]GJD77969.1 hypothetical protein NBEOAGPD_1181 [Methylobacterium gregans]GLS51939.1 hypothetical protein GCM10007886_01210 [Methylobacterium gregans]
MNRPLSHVLAGIAIALDEMVPVPVPNSIAATTQVRFGEAMDAATWNAALEAAERAIDAQGGAYDPRDERAAARDEGYDLAIRAVRALRRPTPVSTRRAA